MQEWGLYGTAQSGSGAGPGGTGRGGDSGGRDAGKEGGRGGVRESSTKVPSFISAAQQWKYPPLISEHSNGWRSQLQVTSMAIRLMTTSYSDKDSAPVLSDR